MRDGLLNLAAKRGAQFLSDVSVTGFDGLTLATALEPELTTLALPAEQVGARGMAALLAVLEGRPPETGDLPVSLAVRGSTAAPRLPGCEVSRMCPVRLLFVIGVLRVCA